MNLCRLRVVLKWRGQWSDCAYWRLSVKAHDIALPSQQFEYRFERDAVNDSDGQRPIVLRTSVKANVRFHPKRTLAC